MRPSSKILVLLGAVLSFLLTARSLLTQSPSSPLAPTIRVETRQVLVPVIVTAHKGHYIRNLGAADFHVYDNGVEQKIVALNTQAGGGPGYFPPQPVEIISKLPESLTPPSESAGLPPSTYLICLDALNSAFGGYGQVRRALEKLFRDQKASDARYGLVVLGRQTRIIQNLTSDPAAILAALSDSKLTGAITQSETNIRTQEEVDLTQMLARYCANCDCSGQTTPSAQNSSYCSGDWHAIEAWADAHSEQRRFLTVNFLTDLRGLVERLGEVPGKRTIIYVSDGFNVQPGRELFGLIAAYTRSQSVLIENTAKEVEPEIQQIVRSAQRRDISFYTLDSRGLEAVFAFDINHEPSGFDVVHFPFQAHPSPSLGLTYLKVQSDRQTMATEKQSALQELAGETGGYFFHNSNDYLKGLRQALDDGEAYYLLAYSPTSLNADGKFHQIKVNVDQKNLTIRAKKGYYAPAAEKSPRMASVPPVPVLPATPAVNPVPPPLPDSKITPGAEQHAATPSPEPHALAPPLAAVNIPRAVVAPKPAAVISSASVMMVDWPLAQLMHSLPQLQDLKPTESQAELPGIMERTGTSVADFMQSVPNFSSQEEVTENQLKRDGKVSKQFKETFDYLVLAQRDSNRVNLREYRADAQGKEIKPAGLTRGYMVTSGAFSAMLCFHPSRQGESSFRFLGEQLVDGHKTYVVVFAQGAGSGEPIGLIRSAGGQSSISTFLQGIAWVDSSTYQIVRLRTDLGPPSLDAAMWRLTSDIHYHEVQLPQFTSSLWVPDNVVVTMSLSNRMWRNEHHYSDLKVFTVGSKLRSGPLE